MTIIKHPLASRWLAVRRVLRRLFRRKHPFVRYWIVTSSGESTDGQTHDETRLQRQAAVTFLETYIDEGTVKKP